MLKQLKYKFSEEIASHFCEWMVECADFKSNVKFVPVPLSRERLKYRGFNQSEILCRGLGDVSHCLKRVRDTGQLAQLSRADRMQRVAGAFEICMDVKGLKLVVVDDVFTSGATMTECVRVLYEAGANNVLGLTLCR